MNGLPWFAFDIDAYEGNTAHLSMLEDGAYNRLLRYYYKTATPLPTKQDQVFRICRAIDESEKQTATSVLNEFFRLEEDGWHNDRADEELAKSSLSYARKAKGFSDRLRMTGEAWKALRDLIFRRDNFTCQYCGRRGGDLECDHVHPVAFGGETVAANLLTSCLDCNRSKGCAPLSNWFCFWPRRVP